MQRRIYDQTWSNERKAWYYVQERNNAQRRAKECHYLAIQYRKLADRADLVESAETRERQWTACAERMDAEYQRHIAGTAFGG